MSRKALHIGQQIAAARKAAGLTQIDLAGRAGLRQPHLSEMEAGARPIGIPALCRLADALGVSFILDADGLRLV